MGVDEGDLQVSINDVDVILENCPITFFVIRYFLVYSTIQCSTYSSNTTWYMILRVIEQYHKTL